MSKSLAGTGSIISSIDDRLSPNDWESLLRGVRPEHRLFTQNWYDAWAQAYLPAEFLQGPLRYLVAREPNGAAVGVLPFVLLRFATLTFLSLAGYYSPFRTVPMVEALGAEVSDSLAEGLTNYRGGLAIRLGPAEDDDPLFLRFLEALQKRGWGVYDIDRGQQQIVDLPHSLETFQMTLGKKLRKNIRWSSNRMKRNGEMEIRAYRDLSPEAWATVIDHIGRVESRCWLMTSEEGKLRFYGERNTRFWRRLLESSETSRLTSAWLIYFNEKPVSFTFAFDAGPCRYNIAGQYDEVVKEYGTGWIVDNAMFEDAILRSVEKVNMGDGHAYYKSRWGAKPVSHLRDYVAFRPGIVGRGLYLAATMKSRLERWYSKIKQSDG